MTAKQLFDYVVSRQFKGFVVRLTEDEDAGLMDFATACPQRWDSYAESLLHALECEGLRKVAQQS